MVIILREFITVLWGRVNWLRERTLWSFWKSIRTTNQIVRRLNWLRGRRTLKNVLKLHGREVGYNILSSLLWYMCKVAQDNISISILWLIQIELLRPNQHVWFPKRRLINILTKRMGRSKFSGVPDDLVWGPPSGFSPSNRSSWWSSQAFLTLIFLFFHFYQTFYYPSLVCSSCGKFYLPFSACPSEPAQSPWFLSAHEHWAWTGGSFFLSTSSYLHAIGDFLQAGASSRINYGCKLSCFWH